MRSLLNRAVMRSTWLDPLRVSCSQLLMDQTKKLFYRIAVLLVIIILHSQSCKAQQVTCHHNVSYTKGSKFESNLNTVMNRLVQNASQTGFNTSENGQSPDQIYGLLQCRGDRTVEQCYNCSLQANTTLRENCENAGGGLIWYEECFLRYENYSFLGQLDTGAGWYLWNLQNVSSHEVFNQAVVILFANLSAEAASESSKNRYASGTTVDSLFRKIHALVQCTSDLSADTCSTCLLNKIANIFAPYAEKQGARGYSASCSARYETFSFFNPIVPSPSPAPAPPNRPVAHTEGNQTSTQNYKSSNKIAIILGVAGSLLLVLFVCVFAAGRRLKSVIFGRPSEGIA